MPRTLPTHLGRVVRCVCLFMRSFLQVRPRCEEASAGGGLHRKTSTIAGLLVLSVNGLH